MYLCSSTFMTVYKTGQIHLYGLVLFVVLRRSGFYVTNVTLRNSAVGFLSGFTVCYIFIVCELPRFA